MKKVLATVLTIFMLGSSSPVENHVFETEGAVTIEEVSSTEVTATVETHYTYDIVGDYIPYGSEEYIEATTPPNMKTISPWAKDTIMTAESFGIIKTTDYEDYSVYITKQQFCNILYNAYSYLCNNLDKDRDMSLDHFNDTFGKEIGILKHNRILVSLDTNLNKFYPEQQLSKEEAAFIITNLYRVLRGISSTETLADTKKISTVFNDDSSINSSMKDSLYFENLIGTMNASEDNFIEPKKSITIEESICYIMRIINYIEQYDSITDPVLSNKLNTYTLLTAVSGLNRAAVIGIMSNIAVETGHRYEPFVQEAGGTGPGYGLCQWTTSSRKQGLYDFCENNGYEHDTIEGQVNYIMYELETLTPDTYEILKEVDDSSEGAYKAAYYFCKYYEAPANMDYNTNLRGNLAIKMYEEV